MNARENYVKIVTPDTEVKHVHNLAATKYWRISTIQVVVFRFDLECNILAPHVRKMCPVLQRKESDYYKSGIKDAAKFLCRNVQRCFESSKSTYTINLRS